METELLLIGYKCFKSKTEKMFYVLSFLTPPVTSQDKHSCTSSNVDIFVSEQKYYEFIKSSKILDTVKAKYLINGNKVSYFI